MKPSTLAEQVTSELAMRITLRRVPPGHRVLEKDIVSEFGVSRPLAREVLRLLEVRGLVENVPWKGAKVPVLSETQLSDLYDFGGLVFGFIARLAATRATPHQLNAFNGVVKKLKTTASASPDIEDYERVRLTAYEQLSECLGDMTDLVHRRPIVRRIEHQFGSDMLATKVLRKQSAQRWEELCEIIRAGDAAAAEAHAKRMTEIGKTYGLKAHRAINMT